MTENTELRPIEELTFREAMAELDGIVGVLESNSLELEDSLRSYERGVALLAALQGRLAEAQQKLDVLMGELVADADDGARDTSLSERGKPAFEKEKDMRKEDCLFCKIVAGEIPSAKVYEDDRVLAFEDVNPQMPVHTLIVPKNHYDNIGDGIPDDEMGYLFNTVKKIAELKGIAESGYRVIVNTNDDAQQSVHHIHVHVLGGAPMNSGDPSAK